MSHIQAPAEGQKIVAGKAVPNNPIIPFIEGDGIGVDITPVMKDVIDAAVAKAYGGEKKIHWMEVFAGEKPPVCMATMFGCRKKLWRHSKTMWCLSKAR